MAGAVHYGTARRLGLNFNEEEISRQDRNLLSCAARALAGSPRTRIPPADASWVVVFSGGGRPTFGPKAAEIAAGDVSQSLTITTLFIAGTPKLVNAVATGA